MGTEVSTVLRVEGTSAGAPTPWDGEYIVGWDFAVPLLATTDDPLLATTWPTAAAALEAWRTIDEARPWRPDGKPNRPLTAFTVTVLQRDQAIAEAQR